MKNVYATTQKIVVLTILANAHFASACEAPPTQVTSIAISRSTVNRIVGSLTPHKRYVGMYKGTQKTNIRLPWPPEITNVDPRYKITPSYAPHKKRFPLDTDSIQVPTAKEDNDPDENTIATEPVSPLPVAPIPVSPLPCAPSQDTIINEQTVLKAVQNLTNDYDYATKPGGDIIGYIVWPPALELQEQKQFAYDSSWETVTSKGKRKNEPPKPLAKEEPRIFSSLNQFYQPESYLVPIYESYVKDNDDANEYPIRPIDRNSLRPDDGSSCIETLAHSSIKLFSDPKNHLTIAITHGRGERDHRPKFTKPIAYDQRVSQWFAYPEKALVEAGYTSKYNKNYQQSKKVRDFIPVQHNFAFAIDQYLEEFGVITKWENKICILIPAAFISTYKHKGKERKSIDPFILTYTFSTKADKKWLEERTGLMLDTDHLYHRCAYPASNSQFNGYLGIRKRAESLAEQLSTT